MTSSIVTSRLAMRTCVQRAVRSDSDVAPVDVQASSSLGVCSQQKPAPRTRSQRRLHWRRIAWLAHIAHERESLLINRLVELPATSTSTMTSAVCGTSTTTLTSVAATTSVACGKSTSTMTSVACQTSLENAATFDPLPVSLHVDESCINDPVYTKLRATVLSQTMQDLLLSCQQLCKQLDLAVAAIEPRAALIHIDYQLCHDDWLPTNTIVTIADLDVLAAVIFPFCDNIGIIVRRQERDRSYEVRMLSSGDVVTYPWHRVDELGMVCLRDGREALVTALAPQCEGMPQLELQLNTGEYIHARYSDLRQAVI
eukprot:TRINITY_DN4064_c0_g4_i3.p1 TRINITY_DN4064_c0_g4~~TRINITY_DN4064_c0_g4_i3.p1  ORF type:complete len:313 (+),score=3.99 TRINITY_DN4064_c0_g4_i3:67-1005(+)